MTVRFVNLGLPKSGTSTLARALREAGLKAADHKIRRGAPRPKALTGRFIAQELYQAYFDSGNPFETLGFYDALTEISMLNHHGSFWPQCDYAMLAAMRAQPGVRFIATHRPAAEIENSMMRWNNLGSDRLPRTNIPGMPRGFGATAAERLRWINGHYAMLRDLFGEDPRFLELPVCAPEAPEQLSAFIGRTLPWWGRENANPEGRAAS